MTRTINYKSQVLPQDNPNDSHLGDDWYLDASAELPFSLISRSRVAERSYLRVSAINLLNNLPEYSNFSGGLVGYDPYRADLVGRMVTLTLGHRF